MPKFVLTCLVTIEGNSQPETATVGVSSPTTDYYPNRAKREVENYYREKYPGRKVAVVIQDKREVTNDEYLKASVGFIEIT